MPSNSLFAHPVRLLLIVLVIAAILVAAYFVTSGTAAKTTKYAKLILLLSSGKQVQLSQVTSVLNLTIGANSIQNIVQNPSGTSSNVTWAGGGSVSAEYSGLNIDLPFKYMMAELENSSYVKATINLNVLKNNISETYINTPTIAYNCSNQNQTSSELDSLLGGVGGSSGATQPDYKCVATAPLNKTLGSLNASTLRAANAILGVIENNTYINSTKVSYTSYKGNSCVYVSGYIRSNTISLAEVVRAYYATQNNSYAGQYENLSEYDNDSVSFSGPYSGCISSSTGFVYNFTTAQNFTLRYSESGLGLGDQQPAVTTINASLDVHGNVTQIGKPQPTSVIAQPPYPVVNGTCTSSSVDISTISGYYGYYTCSSVDMNDSGYLKLVLQSYNPGYYSGTPGAVRIYGLACAAYNSTSDYYSINEFNSTAYQPTNITFDPGQPITLISKCLRSGNASGKEYVGLLYAVSEENYSGTLENTSSALTGFSVFPTISGSFGKNENTGRVPPAVVLPTTTIYTFNYSTTTIAPATTIPIGSTTIPSGKLSGSVCTTTISTYYSGTMPAGVTFNYTLYGGGGGGTGNADGYNGSKATGTYSFSAGSNLTVYVGGGGGAAGQVGTGQNVAYGDGGGGGATVLLNDDSIIATALGGNGGTGDSGSGGSGGGTGESEGFCGLSIYAGCAGGGGGHEGGGGGASGDSSGPEIGGSSPGGASGGHGDIGGSASESGWGDGGGGSLGSGGGGGAVYGGVGGAGGSDGGAGTSGSSGSGGAGSGKGLGGGNYQGGGGGSVTLTWKGIDGSCNLSSA